MFNFVKVGAADAPYVKGHLPSVGGVKVRGPSPKVRGPVKLRSHPE